MNTDQFLYRGRIIFFSRHWRGARTPWHVAKTGQSFRSATDAKAFVDTLPL
jgi:hypothetical protein